MVGSKCSLGWCGAMLAACFLTSPDVDAFTFHETKDGLLARWQTNEVEFVVDPSFLELGPEALDALQASFDAWGHIDGAYAPTLSFHVGKVDEVGYQPGRKNQNTVRYAPDGYAAAGKGLMITVLSYDEHGVIVDADLVVNGGPDRPFGFASAADAGTEPANRERFFDVQNVLTHEVGHVLGLDEEEDLPDATMFPRSLPLETKKRDLDRDDEDGIRQLYSEPLLTDTADATCRVSTPGREVASPWGGASALLLGVATVVRRVRSARSPRPRPPQG